MRIVTGMHRSGTSLTARIVHAAGEAMGGPADFIPADRWNPGGYFERRDVVAQNLALVHGTMGRIGFFAPPSAATIRARARRRGAELSRLALRHDGLVVKDARFCLTLDAWREQGAHVERVLVCIREPDAVARSLARRNLAPRALGLRLWALHHRRLLDSLGDTPTRFLLYSDLVDGERGPVAVAAALRFLGSEEGAARAAELHGACVDATLDHGGGPPGAYPPTVAALWARVLALHREQAEAPRSPGVAARRPW